MGLILKITVTIICMGPFVAIFRHTQMMLLSNIRNPIINRPQNHQTWWVLCLPSPHGSCLWHWLNPTFDAHLPKLRLEEEITGKGLPLRSSGRSGWFCGDFYYKTVLQGVVMLKKWLSLYSFFFHFFLFLSRLPGIQTVKNLNNTGRWPDIRINHKGFAWKS